MYILNPKKEYSEVMHLFDKNRISDVDFPQEKKKSHGMNVVVLSIQ